MRYAKAKIKTFLGKFSPEDPIPYDARGELEIYNVKNKFNYEIYDPKTGQIVDK